MAKLVQAVREFGPKLKLYSTIKLNDVAEWIGLRAGMSRHMVAMVTYELAEAISYHTGQGNPVKLDGIGIFTPSIDRHGKIKINFRADPALTKSMKVTTYSGTIENKRRIRLNDKGYKALWDAENPHNPLEIKGH
ncbi:MAG: hypothetical protein KDJ65_28590 [Anaerolineae bacterium]|nr:hypothetical protein [Anaerolineae bacterium]